MALDPHYIPFYNIAQFIWDKESGVPLSAGTVKFWVDTQRATPKEVFRLSGVSPNYTYTSLGAELTLGATGAFVDLSGDPVVIYAYPYDADGNIQRYYIEVFAEDETPQFVVEAAPYVFKIELPPDQIISGDNELNNPQFVEVSFNPQAPYTYTFTAAVNEVVEVAPNWQIVASGTGTITVERVVLTETNTPSNPPYVLDITSTGLGDLTLYQRLENSPRLLAGTFVSGYFIAASEDGLQHALQMEYMPSGGALTENTIIDETITSDGSYNVLQGNLEITGTINPDPATTGYVDVQIIIPVGAHIRVSSFQIVQVNTGINVLFGELSTQKQKNQLFQYYENQTVQQSRDNLLVNWGNVKISQFRATSLANVASQCSYVADQTILYQTGANKFQFGISEVDNFVLKPQAAATDCRFALIQYIQPATINGYSGYYLSSLIRALLETIQDTTTRLKVRLIWRADAPPTIGATEPISSWANGTDPTFSAGWTAVVPLNDPAYSVSELFESTLGEDTMPPYTFDQMQMPNTGNDLFVGLVVYIMDALDSTTGDEDLFYLGRMSLTNTQFGVDANPVTFDQNLINCEYYYEKSYDEGTLPGTATDVGILIAYQDSFKADIDTSVFVKPTTFQINFHTPKRDIPTMALYANNGALNSVTVVAQSETAGPTFEQVESVVALAGIWGGAGDSAKRKHYTPGTLVAIEVAGFSSGADDTNAYLIYHYDADARLGI